MPPVLMKMMLLIMKTTDLLPNPSIFNSDLYYFPQSHSIFHKSDRTKYGAASPELDFGKVLSGHSLLGAQWTQEYCFYSYTVGYFLYSQTIVFTMVVGIIARNYKIFMINKIIILIICHNFNIHLYILMY